ncbi:MAG: hypothetical protein HGA22_11200 [Clostridiales bacterium]|nr:hypothetical protein [Clostridiales bacterium]
MKTNVVKQILTLITALVLISLLGALSRTFHPLVSGESKNFSPSLLFIIQFIVYCLAGCVFGLEKILAERKKTGKWKINISRLLVLGIPSLFFGLYILLYYTFSFLPSYNYVFIDNEMFIRLMQMGFGYTVITSFYKAEGI